MITWTPPTFTDNVGVVSVIHTNSPGDTFNPGQSSVTYTAKDAAQNIITCVFSVVVKRKWVSVLPLFNRHKLCTVNRMTSTAIWNKQVGL